MRESRSCLPPQKNGHTSSDACPFPQTELSPTLSKVKKGGAGLYPDEEGTRVSQPQEKEEKPATAELNIFSRTAVLLHLRT